MTSNPYFELEGISHAAMVSSDMAKTVDFYNGVLGMPLLHTVQMAHGVQHFVFDINGTSNIGLMFDPNGGSADKPEHLLGADGTVNHIAIRVDANKVPAYFERLRECGVPAILGVHYVPDSPSDLTWKANPVPMTVDDINEDTIGIAVYFTDPDGNQLEFSGFLPVGREKLMSVKREPLKPQSRDYADADTALTYPEYRLGGGEFPAA